MTVRRKLRSQSGASMILALFFFFFCAAVGAIVLTAATANSGRTARLKMEDQHRLSAESSARLLRDSLSILSFQGTYSVHDWEREEVRESIDKDGNTTYEYYYIQMPLEYKAEEIKTTGDDVWVAQLQEQLKLLYLSKTPVANAGFTQTPIQFILTGDALSESQIHGTLTLTKDYMIEVSLSRAPVPDEENPSDKRDNYMYFTLAPVLETSESTKVISPSAPKNQYFYHTTTIQWAVGDIMKGVKSSEPSAS